MARRLGLSLLLTTLCLGLFWPPAAQAQPVQVTADTPFSAWDIRTQVQDKVRVTLAGSIFIYLVNLMTFATDRLAYDTAVMIASGGPAESPLYDGTPVEQYFKEYGASVVGESIGLLQEQLEDGAAGAFFEGFDLCKPRIDVTIGLNLGLQGVFDRSGTRPPKCDFKELESNWSGFVAGLSGTSEEKNQTILTQLANAFDPQTNEFAVGVELQSSILNKVLQDSFFKANVRIKEGGFSAVTNFITGNEETPAELIRTTYLTKQEDKTQSRLRTINALQSNRDALLQIGIHAGSVFTNTLLSEFTQQLYTGLFEADTVFVDPFADIETIATSNIDSAADQYRSMLAFTPFEITNYSILADFSSCPSGVARGLYNCVADNAFIAAIGRAEAGVPLTIEEAIEENLLDGSWPLIPSADLARNQDPFCYTYGFCHSNLVKLRKARVIPIGWELAAESEFNYIEDTATLQEVVDGFDDCNLAGGSDINHPWCKLIDPNWVLKYPDTQCRALVNGQLLVSAEIAERQQECVDMPSCIAENDDGTCTGGYGYCVKEENTWRFRGETCPAQYASCLTFEGEDKTVAYLENTVDFANCSADNAGCLWYNSQKADPEADGTYDWQPVTDIALADAATDAYTERLYFTGQVEDCDASNGGCSEVYARDDSVRLNVVQNPSFEDDTNNDSVADGWLRNDAAVVFESGDTARTGSDVVRVGPDYLASQTGIAVSQGRFYTLSYYARQIVDGSRGQAQASLEFLTAGASDDIDLNGTSFVAGANTTCVVTDSGNFVHGDGLGDVLSLEGQPAGTEYERYSCIFTSPIINDASTLIVATLSLAGEVYIDDIQLEQGESTSDYHVGYSSSSPAALTVKVPPSYLGCQGDDFDSPECANYAQVCSENDVGCTAYSPVNGDPTVTGVATELDACPVACVGYDTFKQEATLYEPAGVFPVYLIPASGESCSAEYVGCDEFTNLSTEALEYYTYLRACITPAQAAANLNDDNEATFYTWEGSDLAGYQLKTWTLLESNMTGVHTYISGGLDLTPGLAPCSIWTATADGIVCNDELDSDGDLHTDWDTVACDDNNDIFLNPDCREFYDANGGIHYREWSKTVSVNEACATYRKTTLAGNDIAEQTVNCQNSGGFFDDATGTCRYNGFSGESVECPAEANGCRSYTGGRSRNSRVVLEDTLEAGHLNNWDAGSAADVTLSNESLATNGHSIAATNTFASFIFDNGSVCVDPAGCPGTAQTLGGTCTVLEGEQMCGTLENNLFAGKTYTLSFWAKGSGDLTAAFDLGAVPGSPAAEVLFGTIALTSGWQQFSLGPLNMAAEAYPLFGAGTTLVFDPSELAYIDNLTLREGEDDLTLIKDSWVTPLECDQAPTGASSPQYYLGCQEYQTQDNQTAYLKSFSRLCADDKVGCEDFFQTHESISPYAQVFGATCANPSGLAVTSPTACYYADDGAGGFDGLSQYLCTIGVGQTSCDFDLNWYEEQSILPDHITYGPSTVIVPADSDIFLVINDDVTCSSADAGCQEVGLPDWNQDHNSTSGATSVYLMNEPDLYTDILCNAGELFCAAWDTDDDGTFYFKDPGNHTCAYRENVLINGTDYDGWFRAGTDEFCYGTCSDGVTACSSDAECGGAPDSCNTLDPSYVINGTLSGVWRNGDDEYLGWVGECEAQYSTCSEFQDPLDLETDELYQLADGTQYFYLNNQSLDETVLPGSQRCDGQVSLKEGCTLFNDTSEPAQGYNASASEMLSTHADVLVGRAPYALVDPVDCEIGDSSITLADGTVVDLCAQRCLYDLGLVNDITDGVSRLTKLVEEVTLGNTDLYNYDDLYMAGTSCFAADDCGTMRSQSGAEIAALDCASDARVTRVSAPGGEERTSVPRLENDTNTILKVNRDRQCSEWLSCAEDQASWDTRTNSWKTVCTDVELCTKYSSVGGTTFCSAWKGTEAEIVLDDEIYTNRDTSWYGQEYSGYAIPDSFPVHTLEQANVAPPSGYCNLIDALKFDDVTQLQFDTNHGDACEPAGACVFDGTDYCVTEDVPDYRLALVAGACDANYGADCSVGFCEDTGAACANTSDCGSDGGSCIVGSCRLDTGNLCTGDSECSEDEICSGTTCIVPGADITIEDFNLNTADPNQACNAAAGEVFAEHVAFQLGSCIRSQCVLTPTGQTFQVDSSEGKICRGQPEEDSPFSNELVERWADPDTGGVALAPGELPEDNDDVPYQIRSGFAGANFCAPGENCECSYKKLTFGEGDEIRYWDNDTPLPYTTGLCTAGLVNKTCTSDSACDPNPDDSDVEGECALITREDILLGLDGYCLEKDSGININGNRAENACLTWLPVDQLAGSTDLYAKFTEAGYFTDAYACTSVSPFANLTLSEHSLDSQLIGCSDAEQTDITQDDSDDIAILNVCAQNIMNGNACPDGFWALMGQPQAQDNGVDDTLGQICTNLLSGNDCPFVCVPWDATVYDDDKEAFVSCNPDETFTQDLLDEVLVTDGGAAIENWTADIDVNNVYVVSASITDMNAAADKLVYQRFDELVTELEQCSLKGVRASDTEEDSYGFSWQRFAAGLTKPFKLQAEFYVGCSEITQLTSFDHGQGYAWTDRLLGPEPVSGWSGVLQTLTPGLPMTVDTLPSNGLGYGFATNLEALAFDDYWPAIPATCVDTISESFLVQAQGVSPFNSCGGDYQTFATEQEDNAFSVPPSVGLMTRTNPTSSDIHALTAFHLGPGAEAPYVENEEGDIEGFDTSILSYDSVYGLVNQLFAGVKLGFDNLFTWNPEAEYFNSEGAREYTSGSIIDDRGLEANDVRAEEGNPPKVWSLQSGTCVGTMCEEGAEGSLTLNDQNNGSHESNEFFRAYLKFYAAADKNQLPIRRVIVDWGDGLGERKLGFQGSSGEDNFYKNHRGLDDRSDISICDLDNEWGQTDQSCDPNYFSYSHVYTCNSEILRGDSCLYNSQGVLTNSPCWIEQGVDDFACVFQPAVHIRDNWGWCTGECASSSSEDDSDGCYEGDYIDSLVESDNAISECGYIAEYTVGGVVDPWVYYDGQVIVDPDTQ